MNKILISSLLFIGGGLFSQAQINIGNVGGTQVLNNSSSLSGVNNGPILQFIVMAQTAVTRLVPFMIGLAVLAFFWYIVKFIWKGEESGEARSTAIKGMGYSILAIFVMVSIWGIISALGGMLGIGQGGSLPPLQMPGVK